VRSAFLNGRYGIYGFPSFFPLCFLYKMPPALFLAMGLAMLTCVVARLDHLRAGLGNSTRFFRHGLYATAPLWILLVIYWTTSVTRGINIGLRHILPTFPATFILCGLAGIWLHSLNRRNAVAAKERTDEQRSENSEPPTEPMTTMNAGTPVAPSTTDDPAEPVAAAEAPADAAAREENALRPYGPDPQAFLKGSTRGTILFMQILVVISLVWHVAETALADGNYLAYFNFIAGGPDEGYKHLVDSSLDWGQELGNLKRWLDDHASELPPAV
jgi:hypothetical protein